MSLIKKKPLFPGKPTPPAVPTTPPPVPWAGTIITNCPKCKNRGWYFKNVLAGQTTTCECKQVSSDREEAYYEA